MFLLFAGIEINIETVVKCVQLVSFTGIVGINNNKTSFVWETESEMKNIFWIWINRMSVNYTVGNVTKYKPEIIWCFIVLF